MSTLCFIVPPSRESDPVGAGSLLTLGLSLCVRNGVLNSLIIDAVAPSEPLATWKGTLRAAFLIR